MIDALQKEYPDIIKAQEAIDLYLKNLLIIKLLKLFPSFIFIFITRLVKSYLMIYHFILSFPSYSTLHKRELKIIFKNKQKLRALYSYIGKLGRRYFISNKIKCPVLLDEGATQLVFALFLRDDYSNEIDYNEIDFFLNNYPMPDILYYFDSPSSEEIINRLKLRGMKRLNKYIKRINSNNKDINLVIVNNFVEKSIQIQSYIIKILNKKNFPLYSSKTLIKGFNND